MGMVYLSRDGVAEAKGIRIPVALVHVASVEDRETEREQSSGVVGQVCVPLRPSIFCLELPSHIRVLHLKISPLSPTYNLLGDPFSCLYH
jgi:hypothetical protein